MSNPSCTDEEIIMASKQAHCHGFIKHLPNVSIVSIVPKYLKKKCFISKTMMTWRGGEGRFQSQHAGSQVCTLHKRSLNHSLQSLLRILYGQLMG